MVVEVVDVLVVVELTRAETLVVVDCPVVVKKVEVNVLRVIVLANDGLRLWLGTDFAQHSTRVLQLLALPNEARQLGRQVSTGSGADAGHGRS